MQPNRIAVWLTAVAGLSGAIAVPVANMDGSSTAGVIAGISAIAVVVHKWLDGWQKHEQGERDIAWATGETEAVDSDPEIDDPDLDTIPVDVKPHVELDG